MRLLSLAKQLLSLLDVPTRRKILGIWALMLLAGMLEMAGIGLFFPFFQALANPSELANLPVVGNSLAALVLANPKALILWGCLLLFLFFLAKGIIIISITHLQNSFIMSLNAKFARNLLECYLHQPYLFHLQRNSAELIRNIKLSVSRAIGRGLQAVMQLVLELVTTFAILTLLMTVQPTATLAVVAGLLGILTLYYLVVRKRVAKWGEFILVYDGQTYLWLNQALGSIKETKISGMEHFFVERFAAPAQKRAHYDALAATLPNAPRLITETIAVGGMLAVIAVMTLSDTNLNQVLPILGLFALAAIRLMPAASRIVSNVSLFREAGSAIETVYDDLRMTYEVRTTSGKEAHVFAKDIRCENLSYAYSSDEPVLKNIDLVIGRGESVAVFGASGAGKSTLIDVVLGLLEPTGGKVLIDGVDLRNCGFDWQSKIGYVPQHIYLIDDTLRRNIALGTADELIDDDRVNQVLVMAQLGALLTMLPEGLQTMLGEHGTRLSGGQRQRIGIARALYHDPDVLIMDEATSALDAETEREINRSLTQLGGDKTIIIIAHRLSTVRTCQRVIFLKDGQLAASGAFDELAESNADFQKLAQGY